MAELFKTCEEQTNSSIEFLCHRLPDTMDWMTAWGIHLRGEATMTSYGIQVDFMLLIPLGTITLAFLVFFQAYRRGLLNWKSAVLMVARIISYVILWQVIFIALDFLTYTGGTIDVIRLKENLDYLASYIITLVAASVVERRITERT
jgi:hypothetical protein